MRPPALARLASLLLRAACAACAACAAHAPPPGATHPASSSAPIGRLAGPPASLRPGAVSYPDVPITAPSAPPPHSGHHHAP
jgi:hypothetical protein